VWVTATRIEQLVSFGSVKQTRLRRCPAFGQPDRYCCRDFFIQVGQYLLDDHRALGSGDQLDRTAAFTAYVDIEHTLEPLRRGHSGPALYATSRIGEGANT
jgi:hypothetical protein